MITNSPDKSMEVKLPAFLRNNERKIDRWTAYRKVSPSISKNLKNLNKEKIHVLLWKCVVMRLVCHVGL